MSSSGKRRDSQAVRNYDTQPAVELGKLREGCILWICTQAWVDRQIPSLTDGFNMDDWVYGHPCVVLSLFRHDSSRAQIVKVAPLTSHPQGRLSEYIPIFPVDAVNGSQLRLRNEHKLDKPSYVKKICFEIDYRMLGSYRGVGADTFRLTKGSMKTLSSAKMPPVIKWAPRSQPVSSSSNGNMVWPDDGSAQRPNFAAERLSRDVEARPLLGQPDSLVTEDGSSAYVAKSSSAAGFPRRRYIAESTLKLVLCLPVLLVLIVGVVARFILDFVLSGPVTTYDAAAKVLLSLREKSLADVGGNC